MNDDVDETELFEYEGYVCAVRMRQSWSTARSPWYQGVMYLKGGGQQMSNWYTKPEDAIKIAKVMARQEKK